MKVVTADTYALCIHIYICWTRKYLHWQSQRGVPIAVSPFGILPWPLRMGDSPIGLSACEIPLLGSGRAGHIQVLNLGCTLDIPPMEICLVSSNGFKFPRMGRNYLEWF